MYKFRELYVLDIFTFAKAEIFSRKLESWKQKKSIQFKNHIAKICGLYKFVQLQC